MWQYQQSTGELTHNTIHIANGYSGAEPDGKNKPEAQTIHDVGPIPQGTWLIIGPPINTPAHGPFVLHLQAGPNTETFGRDGFLMHGDSVEHPGQASEGCIIMPRDVREQVWNSKDPSLTVVA